MNDYKSLDKLWDWSFILVEVVTLTAFGSFLFRTAIQIFFIGVTVMRFEVSRKETTTLLTEKILFFVWCVISCLWAAYPEASVKHLMTMLQCILLSMSVLLYVSNGDEKRRNLALKMLIISTAFLVLIVLRSYSIQTLLSGELKSEDRISANGLNSNFIGICASYSILILIGYGKQLGIKMFVRVPLIAVFCGFALLTGSRKSTLTIVIGIALLGIFSAKNISRLLINLMIAAMVAVGLWQLMMGVDFLYETIGYRFQNLLGFFSGEGQDYSAFSRSVMMQQAWDIFTEHPVLGIGLYNYKIVSYYQRVSHSNYIELLANIGLIGFVLYYFTQVSLTIKMGLEVLKGRKCYVIFFVLMICRLINDAITVTYYDEMHQIILMGFLGAFISLRYENEVGEAEA